MFTHEEVEEFISTQRKDFAVWDLLNSGEESESFQIQEGWIRGNE
jgi:hypothetical protein